MLAKKNTVRIVRGTLPPTKSYRHRSWSWSKVAGNFLARVKINVGKGSEDYLFDEIHDEPEFQTGWRYFVFARQSGEFTLKAPGFYCVKVSPSGIFTCTCIGDCTRHHVGACKHGDTVRELLACGVVPAASACYQAVPAGA